MLSILSEGFWLILSECRGWKCQARAEKIWDYEAAGCCHGVVMRHKSWFDGSGCLDQEGHGLRTAETLSSVTEQERGLFWSLDDVDLIFWFIIPTPPWLSLSSLHISCLLSLSLSLPLSHFLMDWYLTGLWLSVMGRSSSIKVNLGSPERKKKSWHITARGNDGRWLITCSFLW